MLDKEDFAIIGYGGHAYVVIDSFNHLGKNVKYYTAKKECKENPFELVYLGFESDLNFKCWGLKLNYILGIGDNKIRQKAAKFMISNTKNIISVIHPNSSISKTAELGIGVFISSGVLINTLAKIGDFVILNSGCIIEHECEIDEAAHIAPGAVLAGNVKIGKRSFIGANAVVVQGVNIGDDVIVGAGSVILEDIQDNKVVVGNPSRILK